MTESNSWVASQPNGGTSSFTTAVGGWYERYKKIQDKKLDNMGLQNLASGKMFTSEDVVKFTSNPYISQQLNKLDSKLKFLQKIDNSPYVQVLRNSGLVESIIGDGSIDQMLSGGAPSAQAVERVWTFLDESGEKCIPFNVFISLSMKCDSKVVSSPVEEGSFVSYNKTQSPLQLSCTLGFKGTPDELLSAVTTLLEMVNGVNLISVVTPDQEFKNMTIEKMNYSRSADAGIDLLIVECSLVEVRQVKAETSNAKISKRQQRGQVQKKPVSIANLMGSGIRSIAGG